MKLNITQLENNEVLVEASKYNYNVKVILNADKYVEQLATCKSVKDIATLY